ncbi:unnamed protein product [Spodoptera exigua]|nr:unnamed protein product [Spodoptera exigua]
MKRSLCALVVVSAVLKVDMYKCCPIPQLYSDEVLDICGIEKIKEDEESPTKRSPTKHCKFIDEPECKELQAHVDECRPYYQKPKEQDKKMAKKGKKFSTVEDIADISKYCDLKLSVNYQVFGQRYDGLLPPVPEKCFGTTEMHYRNCCVFPPFFTREVAKECGGQMEVLFVDQKNNVTGYRRKAFDCEYWKCVLDKYGLLTQYGDLDEQKFYSHLDLWVSLNPMFTDAMTEAKAFCKETIRPYLPLNACEFFHHQGCFRNYLNVFHSFIFLI